MFEQLVDVNHTAFETGSDNHRKSHRPTVLFVTDRPNQVHSVVRDLDLLVAVRLTSLHSAPDPTAFAMLIADVDLRNHAEVMVMRELAQLAMRNRRRVVCLLREHSEHERVQARFLGCDATLPANCTRDKMIDTIGPLIETTDCKPEHGQSRRVLPDPAVGETAVLLADLLDPSTCVGPAALAAVPAGANVVYDTIRAGGLDAWLDIVWEYDNITYQHCLLVAGLAGAFAHGLGFSHRDRQRLIGGALIHDIGKAQVPLPILNKAGPLTDDELAIMRRHPAIGHELLVHQARSGIAIEPEYLAIVRHHHEYLDGSGYPDALRIDQIPDIIKLVTICDIYAALIERRAYKPKIEPKTALSMLQEMRTKLDLDLVGAFARIITGSQLR